MHAAISRVWNSNTARPARCAVAGRVPVIRRARVLHGSLTANRGGGAILRRVTKTARLDSIPYIDNSRYMESENAIVALAALAQSTRLDVFRRLVRHEPAGIAAGEL